MPNDTSLPASREPIAESGGVPSRPWYLFFSNLFEFLGLGQGVIPAGMLVYVHYDGTRFQLLNNVVYGSSVTNVTIAGGTASGVTIYVLPGNEHDQRLLRHERKHLEQIERDGRALFSLRYSWWTLRNGYWMNPYEVEARAAEGKSP